MHWLLLKVNLMKLLNGEKIMLKIGDKSPDFKLPDQDENIVSLSDFSGKKIVLWFYPKASTPG